MIRAAIRPIGLRRRHGLPGVSSGGVRCPVSRRTCRVARAIPPEPAREMGIRRGSSGHYLRRPRRFQPVPGAQSWYTRLNRYPHPRPPTTRRRALPDFRPELPSCAASAATPPVRSAADGTPSLLPNLASAAKPAMDRRPHTRAIRPGFGHLDPAVLDGAAMNELCGACHRAPSAAAPNLRDPWNARHQPLLLAASACFRASRASSKCVVAMCRTLPLETRLAAYDASCAACHPRRATPPQCKAWLARPAICPP